MADIVQMVDNQLNRVEEQTINHQSKTEEAKDQIATLERKIEEKEKKIGELREQIN